MITFMIYMIDTVISGISFFSCFFFFFFLFDPQVSQGFVSCLFVAMVLEVFMLWLDDNLDT